MSTRESDRSKQRTPEERSAIRAVCACLLDLTYNQTMADEDDVVAGIVGGILGVEPDAPEVMRFFTNYGVEIENITFDLRALLEDLLGK